LHSSVMSVCHAAWTYAIFLERIVVSSLRLAYRQRGV
jgi:hypothetical protein